MALFSKVKSENVQTVEDRGVSNLICQSYYHRLMLRTYGAAELTNIMGFILDISLKEDIHAPN